MFAILLSFIFIRPFISSLAFPYLNFFYSFLFISFLAVWCIARKVTLKELGAFLYPVIFFAAAVALSVILSQNQAISSAELYKYANALLLFAAAGTLSRTERERLLRAVTAAGVAISLLAIYQYFFGFRHLHEYVTSSKITNPFVLDYLNQRRVFLPFVTPNTLAGYLIMIVPLILHDKRNRWAIIPVGLALLLTKSLGAFISLFLALWLYFLIQRKLRRQTVFLLAGVLLVIGLVFIARSGAGQKEHLQPLFSTSMRLGYWKDTLEIIRMNPIVGMGLGNFSLVHSRFSHNSHLQIWAEMGILGISAWMWLIIQSYITGIGNAVRTGKQSEAFLIPLLASHTAFLIHNLIDFNFLLPEVALTWWLFLGLLVAVPQPPPATVHHSS